MIEQEAAKATRGRYDLSGEAEDIRQAAWTAAYEAMARGGGIENTGGYLRRTVRYAIKGYIKALRRDALGHRS